MISCNNCGKNLTSWEAGSIVLTLNQVGLCGQCAHRNWANDFYRMNPGSPPYWLRELFR